MNLKELIRGILSILIIIGALLSLFWSTTAIAFEAIRVLAGIVIGYYFGVGSVPLGRLKVNEPETKEVENVDEKIEENK